MASFILLLVAVLIGGFSKSYFFNFSKTFPWQIHLHVLSMVVWCVLLIVQTFLVKKNNVTLHRKLGKFSAVLVAIIVVTFLNVIRWSVLNGLAHSQHPDRVLGFMIVPLTDVFLFVLFYLLSYYYRKNSQWHRNFVIAATLALLPASIVRVQIFWLSFLQNVDPLVTGMVVTDFTLLCLMVWEKIKSRSLIPYTIAFLTFVGIQLTRSQMQVMEVWQHVARVLINTVS